MCFLLNPGALPNAFVSSCAPVGVFVALCRAFLYLFRTLGGFGVPNVAPRPSILTHLGYSWESFGHFGGTLVLYFGTLELQLGTLGVHVGVLWPLWGVALDPSDHFGGKCSEKVPKMDAKIETFSLRFGVFVESGKQCLDCTCAVGIGVGPLVFIL